MDRRFFSLGNHSFDHGLGQSGAGSGRHNAFVSNQRISQIPQEHAALIGRSIECFFILAMAHVSSPDYSASSAFFLRAFFGFLVSPSSSVVALSTASLEAADPSSAPATKVK